MQYHAGLDAYDVSVKREMIKEGWKHWNSLHIDQIKCLDTRKRFNECHACYYPRQTQHIYSRGMWIPYPLYALDVKTGMYKVPKMAAFADGGYVNAARLHHTYRPKSAMY